MNRIIQIFIISGIVCLVSLTLTVWLNFAWEFYIGQIMLKENFLIIDQLGENKGRIRMIFAGQKRLHNRLKKLER